MDLHSQFRRDVLKTIIGCKSRDLPGKDPVHFKDLDTHSILLKDMAPQPFVSAKTKWGLHTVENIKGME